MLAWLQGRHEKHFQIELPIAVFPHFYYGALWFMATRIFAKCRQGDSATAINQKQQRAFTI